ncbi:phosducin-like protein [Panonychus citri]|uniref:phosducin-like protein n=1 Tax=Panonychus citri TaxID=50023 RepID=UPI00230719F3|nr:phosducin-like protein [Panonychus citri]
MGTLDDKLLGEKKHYYCDSDDDERDDNDDRRSGIFGASGGQSRSMGYANQIQSPLSPTEPYSTNTGPKGVLNDFKRYQELKQERKRSEELSKLKLMEKLSMSCKTYNEELEEKKQQEIVQDELDKLMTDDSDPFLNEYMKKRMSEMMEEVEANRSVRKSGKLIRLTKGEDFLEAIEKEAKDVLVICHIANESNEGCVAMNGCLQCLASKYPFIKFCALDARSAGMSERFKKQGVPALLIYKNGNLVGNFVRLTDEFGEDFYASDVESFLIEHGFLPDKTLVPELMKKKQNRDANQDSDDDDDC